MTLTMMKDLKELHKQIIEQKVIENYYIFTETLLIGSFYVHIVYSHEYIQISDQHDIFLTR